MDRKRPLPLAPPDLDSDPDENSSSDDESEEENDLLKQETFDKPCDDQESESQSKENDLRSKFPTRERDASSLSSSGSDPESDGGSRSELQDASPKFINQNIVLNRNAEANGVAKKPVYDSASARKPLKLERKDEKTAKNVKLERLKRDRDEDTEDKGSVRKRKKRSSGNAGEQNLQKSRLQNIPHIEEVGKEERLSVPNEYKEDNSEKAVHAPSHDAGKELAKKASKQRTEEKSGPMSQKKESRSEKEGRRKEKVLMHIHPETQILKEISPQTTRKSSQSWTPKDEMALSSEILNRVKLGADIPSKKNDEFWVKLSEQLQVKLEAQWSRDQLCEKVKRMKKRYDTMADKLRVSEKPYKHRNSTDPVLFSLWSQIWGNSDDSRSKDNEEVEEGKEEVSTPVVSAKDPIKKSKSILGKNGPRVPTQSKKKSSKTDELDSEGSDDRRGVVGTGFAIKPKEHIAKAAAEVQCGDTTIPMERECMPRHCKFPKDIANSLDLQGGGKSSEPSSDLKKLLHDGVRPLLLEMQEASRIMLEEWLAKADAFIGSALKAAAGVSGPINGLDFSGKEGFSSPPWRCWELRACRFSEREQDFQQQLNELHLQELDIYSQKLQLLQRECKLKQEELRLQFERGR